MLLLVSGSLHRRWRLRGRWRRSCRDCRHGLDPDGRYTMAVHLFYYKSALLIVELLAPFRHLLQPREDKAGQSLEAFVLWKFLIVLSFEGPNVDRYAEDER